MDLNIVGSNTIMPGQRLLTTKGFENAEKFNTPRDVVVPIFDEDLDILYIKSVDTNGNSTLRMFELTEKPIPKFDPEKYVTKDDFNSLKEELLNVVNSIQQSIAAGNGKQQQYERNGGQSNKPNNG